MGRRQVGVGVAGARLSKETGVSPRREGPSVATLGATKPNPSPRRKTPVQRQYVGIDLHRRRSVIVRRDHAGEAIETTKIDNDVADSPEFAVDAHRNSRL